MLVQSYMLYTTNHNVQTPTEQSGHRAEPLRVQVNSFRKLVDDILLRLERPAEGQLKVVSGEIARRVEDGIVGVLRKQAVQLVLAAVRDHFLVVVVHGAGDGDAELP